MENRPLYWFRVPRCEWLKSFSHHDLLCYLVLLESIQDNHEQGALSLAEIAARARVSPHTAQRAVSRLITGHWLLRKRRPRQPSLYSLPFSWRSAKPKATLFRLPKPPR